MAARSDSRQMARARAGSLAEDAAMSVGTRSSTSASAVAAAWKGSRSASADSSQNTKLASVRLDFRQARIQKNYWVCAIGRSDFVESAAKESESAAV